MTDLNPDKYCQNPAQYQEQLNNQIGGANTIAYYNSLCNDMAKSKSSMDNIIDGLKNFKPSANGLLDDAKYIGEKLGNVLTGILSPEGLEVLSIFFGVKILAKNIYKGLAYMITTNITGRITEEVTEKIGQQVGEEVSEHIASTIVARITAEVVERAIQESTMMMVLNLVAAGAEEVMAVFDIIQIIGMVLDMIDPDGYSQEITSGGSESLLGDKSNQLQMINDTFNQGFTDSYLSSFKVGTDRSGRPIYGNIWPIEFYATNLLSLENDPKFKKNMTLYIATYFKCLKFTNDGKPIVNICDPGKSNIIDGSWFKNQKNTSLSLSSDKNSVVANWFAKWYPILIILLISILVIVFIFLRISN